VENVRTEFTKAGVDTIVLGCTHFLHVEALFRKLLGKDFRIVDSREGVSARILQLLKAHDLTDYNGNGPSLFWLTGTPRDPGHYRKIATAFGLAYAGVLNA